jgi:adenylosuccinate synthase
MLRGARLIGDFAVNGGVPGRVVNTAAQLSRRLSEGWHVVIEGVQGYQLGLHAGHYPKCTTADCRAIDFLSMAGVSPWAEGVSRVRVVVVVRVYPIRVAGNSGYLASETTWEALGLPEELTTVTKKVRRVGDWDADWVSQAVRANGGPSRDVVLALSMLDQKYPELRDARPDEFKETHRDFLDTIAIEAAAPVALVGTGPNTMSVYNPSAWL